MTACMTFQKLLCPLDFSAGSQQAMSVAVRLACEGDAELVLLHAWHVPVAAFPMELPFPPPSLQYLIDEARRGLDAAVHDAMALGAKRVSSRLVNGVPWSAIVETLADPTFDLVVIGTRGRTGLARVLLGSTAETVIRHAPCPVLAVRSEERPFQHVLCPIDFSEESRCAVDFAAQLVRPGGAGITLLHVVEAPVSYAGELPEDFLRELDQRSAEHLEACAAQLRSKVSVPVTTQWRIDWPGAGILAVLEREQTIDLVVMGSHGRTGIKRMLLGSVAEKVLRHARCPVFVARKRA
jgi:nucleotide-binding universal stress UspA family protein